MNLQNWINQARDHWKEFQPTKFKDLQKSGMLERALKQAAEQTLLELHDLETSGMDPQGAWEMVRELYLFPPEEPGLSD